MRTITFGGKNSFDDFGLRISSERSGTPGLAGQRTSTETVPHRDGDIVQTAGLGSASLAYCFIVRGSGRADCEARMRAVQMWLTGRTGDLLDSDFPGLKYTNVCMTGEAPEVEWVSRNFRNAYMTVHFTADPIIQEIGADNRRVLKFAANGAATLTVTGNSAYSITANGTTTTGSYTAAEPYKYRLVAYTETAATITLNGTALAPDTVFTMPSSASFALSWTGYGYFELWHDTRTEVRI